MLSASQSLRREPLEGRHALGANKGAVPEELDRALGLALHRLGLEDDARLHRGSIRMGCDLDVAVAPLADCDGPGTQPHYGLLQLSRDVLLRSKRDSKAPGQRRTREGRAACAQIDGHRACRHVPLSAIVACRQRRRVGRQAVAAER